MGRLLHYLCVLELVVGIQGHGGTPRGLGPLCNKLNLSATKEKGDEGEEEVKEGELGEGSSGTAMEDRVYDARDATPTDSATI